MTEVIQEAVKFNGCKLTLELEAQTPHIHFQHDEMGATLRASEVKPKFDRFLNKKIKDKVKPESMYNSKEHKSFDYKVKIIGNAELGKINKADCNIYYGDIKEFNLRDCKIEIICFDNDLQKYIKENIVEFFYVTNFGTMQSKGFGSYKPSIGEKIEDKDITRWLMDNYSTTKAWKYSGIQGNRNERCKNQMRWIKSFYGIMKSGQNSGGYKKSYLFKYINEKPNKYTNSKNEESRYVRGLFGIAGMPVSKSEKGGKGGATSGDKVVVERIPSPVFFKIINNNIFFVIENIADELYGIEFNELKKGKVKMPERSDFDNSSFDTVAFMSEYVEYCNENNNVFGFVKNKKIEEFSDRKGEQLCQNT